MTCESEESGAAAAEIRTERLVLRPLRADDAPAVFAAVADPQLQRFLPTWREHSRAEVEEHVTRRRRYEEGPTFAVTRADDGTFVGECWLNHAAGREPVGDVGWWTGAPYRGLGYGTEAVRALVRWAHEDVLLHRLQAKVAVDNIASLRLALAAGFRREGVVRGAEATPDGFRDLIAYGRLATDPYEATRRRLPDVTELSDGLVVLRPAVRADAEALLACYTDPVTRQWMLATDPPRPEPSLAGVRQRLVEAPARWLAGDEAFFTIVEGASGAIAGVVSLRLTQPDLGLAEVGYEMVPAFRGRGLMRAALRLITRWAFDEVGLARVSAGVGVDNTASLRTAESAGYVREAVLREELPGPNGRYDMVVLGALPGDLR